MALRSRQPLQIKYVPSHRYATEEEWSSPGHVYLPDWAYVWYHAKKRVKVARGGRCSTKSETLARMALRRGTERNTRVLNLREFQNSLAESSHALYAELIPKMGLQNFYRVLNNKIHGINGTEFIFLGAARKRDAIRSMQRINVVIFEEAQRADEDSLVALTPTARAMGSELWFAMNPHRATDPVFSRYIVNEDRDDVLDITVNWRDNPWWPWLHEMHQERDACLQFEPELYDWVWEGALNADLTNQVLSWAALDAVWGKPLGAASERHKVHMGVDLAEMHDQNAICIRKGPEILYLDRVRSDPRALAKDVVAPLCEQFGVTRLYYDAAAGGNGPEFGRECQLIGLSKRVYVKPTHFGGSVEGGDEEYMKGITNKDYFERRNSQMAWAVRQRLAYSTMHLSGTKQDINKCIWFNPGSMRPKV